MLSDDDSETFVTYLFRFHLAPLMQSRSQSYSHVPGREMAAIVEREMTRAQDGSMLRGSGQVATAGRKMS